MNWNKAKTILILFLIAVNISLLTYTIFDGYIQRHTKSQVVQNAINILSKNGIDVDKKVIDSADGKNSVKEVYAYNIISDYSGFAKLIIGNDAQYSGENTYTSSSGEITFWGDCFCAKAKTNSYLRSFDIPLKNVLDTSIQIFAQLGITVNSKDIIIDEKNGIYTVMISKKINTLPVFGSKIVLTLSQFGVTAIEGAWYEQELRETSKINLKDISMCMIDYMNEKKSKKPCTITRITHGYATLDENTYHASLMLTPVIAIENNLGEIIYIDSRENI